MALATRVQAGNNNAMLYIRSWIKPLTHVAAGDEAVDVVNVILSQVQWLCNNNPGVLYRTLHWGADIKSVPSQYYI